MNDNTFMTEALIEARRAFAENEVPIGAVAVFDKKVIARAHNVRERTSNPLGHAEILLLEKLAKEQKSWRLEDVTIYVTCEPCLMCAGALIQARIPRVVYGCRDPKAGACDSLYEVTRDERLNHRIETIGGVMEEECAGILSEFFRMKRKK
jgi:tRNA(adenine34) deaminase